MESGERLNWRMAGIVTSVGVAAIATGVVVGKSTRSTWSSVLINVGTTVGLVAVLLLVERRLTREVTREARSAAREEVAAETADLRQRVIRLENLDEAQSEAWAERQAFREEATQAAMQSGVAVDTVGTLLRAAVDEQLFDFRSGQVRFRTSADPDCHVLYLLGHEAKGRMWAMFLDFQEIRMGPPINEVPMPMRTESMVMWIDDDPGQVAAELEDNLRRANEPLHGFSLQYVLQRVHKSIEVVRAARDAPAGTGERLKGVLRLLINDDWVLTSSGLEAVHSSAIFAPGWVLTATGDHRVQGLRGTRAAIDCNAPSWMEALQWVRAREATRLVFDEDDPLPPQFGPGRRG